MKIKSIEYENFRNFKENGKIVFDTSGKVNIVYGKNGDGKTTLHQLFHWIIYDQVHFNKTASDKMYNLELEKELGFNSQFSVIGKMDFEHDGEDYSLRREWIYKKGVEESKRVKEEISLMKRSEFNDWNRLDRPETIVEEMLPSGLSQYFFFDGESMIADLRVKGKDSANKLKEALYSMFDLKIYEQAIDDIGKIELKTTVLGNLFLSKSNISSSDTSKQLKLQIEQLESKIAEFEQNKIYKEEEKRKVAQFINDLSEKIGSTKSRQEYEEARKRFVNSRDLQMSQIDKAYSSFGEEVAKSIPKLLLLKRIQKAKDVLKLKVEEAKLMPGIRKELILTLIEEDKCICGTVLTDKEKEVLKQNLNLLPPLSYKDSYDSFNKIARTWDAEYNKELLDQPAKLIFQLQTEARRCETEINKIDEKLKESKDIQDLIIDRKKAEERIDDLEKNIRQLDDELLKHKAVLKKKMVHFQTATSGEAGNELIDNKIDVMEEVKKYFQLKLYQSSQVYSEKLKEVIQVLLEKMLTSKRTVSVSNDFFVKVYDSYNDESKSEGQFAVVSFAYIAGILKLLQGEETLKGKEYPLVLDGPFSKLDADQRQTVLDTIPEYAPQIILFSKDDLGEYIDESKVGRVWTINSNDEKNVASIKEGFLWK